MTNSTQNSSLSLFFTILYFVLLSGCNNSQGNKDRKPEDTKTNAISIYSASVNALKLPFKDTCDDIMATQKLNLPDSLSKFKKYGQLVGKISETGNYVAFLYAISADVELPVIYIFNKNGEEISSLKLFIGNCCGENEGCSGLSTLEITKNLHIILKDSTETFERDKKHSDKKRNIQILKKLEEFKIDSSGKILPVK